MRSEVRLQPHLRDPIQSVTSQLSGWVCTETRAGETRLVKVVHTAQSSAFAQSSASVGMGNSMNNVNSMGSGVGGINGISNSIRVMKMIETERRVLDQVNCRQSSQSSLESGKAS